MKTLRNTLLGACLAVPLTFAAGQAQTVEQAGRTIQVPPGAVVLILPAPVAAGISHPGNAMATPRNTAAPAPAAMPMLRMIAQQQAMMQRMIANMNAMFAPMPVMPAMPGVPAMPDASQLLQAAFGAGGPMFALAAGPRVCSESISIVQHGNSAPVVTHSRTGACGASADAKPEGVRLLPPPAAPSHRPELIEAAYPPHVVPNLPPRT